MRGESRNRKKYMADKKNEKNTQLLKQIFTNKNKKKMMRKRKEIYENFTATYTHTYELDFTYP